MALEIDYLGGNCPVQAEGTIDGVPFYFRARGEGWQMHIGSAELSGAPEWCHEEPYGDWPSAGWMTEDEARAFIDKAVTLWRARSMPGLDASIEGSMAERSSAVLGG